MNFREEIPLDRIFHFFFGTPNAQKMTAITVVALIVLVAPNMVAGLLGAIAGGVTNSILIIASRIMEKTLMRREVQDFIAMVVLLWLLFGALRGWSKRK